MYDSGVPGALVVKNTLCMGIYGKCAKTCIKINSQDICHSSGTQASVIDDIREGRVTVAPDSHISISCSGNMLKFPVHSECICTHKACMCLILKGGFQTLLVRVPYHCNILEVRTYIIILNRAAGKLQG